MEAIKNKTVNFILFYIFVFSVFIDIYNGYVHHYTGGGPVIPALYKGFGIIIILFYIVHRKKCSRCIYLLLMLILLCFLSLSYWILLGYIKNSRLEIQMMVKHLYAYCVLLFLLSNKKYITQRLLIDYIILYGVIAALSIIMTSVMGIGVNSYGKDFGFGIKGLFTGGNDVGLAMLMCNCLACYMFLETKRIKYAFINILLTIISMLIGTVAGLFGSVFITACLVLCKYFIKNYKIKTNIYQKLYFNILFLISIFAFYKVINFIVNYDSYNLMKYSLKRLVSGGARNILKEAAIQYMNTYNIFDFLFGRGDSNILKGVEKFLPRSGTIELDQYELLGAYGILLGGVLLAVPLILLYLLIRGYLKYRTNFYFWFSLSVSFLYFMDLRQVMHIQT